jgi:hypothetical protein
MLDYTVPPLQFLIGGFDASQYLDSISLSVPMHEPGQPLLWSGQFKVSNNLKAKSLGLADLDFSEVGTPNRWRPYQQQVRLNIRGYQSPVFRIEDYRYNPQSLTGEGKLTQIPTAIAGDRPGEEIPTTVSGSIGGAIYRLLAAAFLGSSIAPGVAVDGDAGVLDIPLVTRNPWGDALRLSSLGWNWFTVNATEALVSVNGAGGGLIFSRAIDRVELVPDLAAIFQSAQNVIVTGARQVPDLTPAVANTVPQAPRPKFKTTTEYRPAGTIFPSLGTSTTPTLLEEKTIIYQYWDDDTWSDYLPFGTFLTTFLYDIQSQTQTGINPYGQPPPDLNVPLQTITIKRQPKGYLFPALGTDVSLTEAEVLVESNLRKLTLKPLGLLFPSLGTSLVLGIEKRETLTSALIPPGAQLTVPATSASGQPQQYEARPRLETPQPIPTRPLKTQVLKGQAAVLPLNWTPVFAKPLVVDFGFLPDAGRAAYLAEKIAVREQRRRDQVLVDMPIPEEWLANGWPVLAKCQIANDVWLMDGCALSIEQGQAKFGFTGALVSRGGVVPYVITTEINADLVLEVSVTTSLSVVPLPVGIVVTIDAELVVEANVVTSAATIVSVVNADLIIEATVTTSAPMAAVQIINFSVSPASELEGTPSASGVQTINFSVSNASELEG